MRIRTASQRARENRLRRYRRRVARGTKWLDATKPGWADLLDLTTLRVAAGDGSCIMGQLAHRDAKFIAPNKWEPLGFLLEDLRGDDIEVPFHVAHKDHYDSLQRMWMPVIKARRS